MNNKKITLIPGITEKDSENRIIEYGNSIKYKDSNNKENIKIKFGWFESFTELYHEIMKRELPEYMEQIPLEILSKKTIQTSASDLSKEYGIPLADIREIVFNKFHEDSFFYLWYMVLYNPMVKPTSKKQISKTNIKNLTDIIEEHFLSLKCYYYLINYEPSSKFFEKEENIGRTLELLFKADQGINKNQSRKRFVYEIVLRKYNKQYVPDKSDALLKVFTKFVKKYQKYFTDIIKDFDNLDENNSEFQTMYKRLLEYRKDELKKK